MTSMRAADRFGRFTVRAAAVGVAVVLVALAGCGDKKPSASQTAVKVNDDEITVHQINFVMQQQRGLRPEQADTASRQILERLIDQQLAIEKADDLKLDRDPRVVQQLEAAKREILARAYFDRVGDAASRPTPEEIEQYFNEQPALFKERRVYQLQEIAIQATPEQVATLKAELQAAPDVAKFVEYLKQNDFRFSGNQAVRSAEQLPLASLQRFAQMKDGQATMTTTANGVQVLVLAGSRSAPVGLEQARPAIERFLLNDRKRKLIADDVKAMRAAAKIEYVGKFGEGAPPATTDGDQPLVPPPATDSPPPALSDTASAPGANPAPSGTQPGSLTPADISKGLGLK